MTMVEISTVQGVQDLLSLLKADSEVILTEANIPVAKVTPMSHANIPKDGRVPNTVHDVWVSDDFDEQVPEEYWNSRKL